MTTEDLLTVLAEQERLFVTKGQHTWEAGYSCGHLCHGQTLRDALERLALQTLSQARETMTILERDGGADKLLTAVRATVKTLAEAMDKDTETRRSLRESKGL